MRSKVAGARLPKTERAETASSPAEPDETLTTIHYERKLMRCITVLYPNSPDLRFDFDYYANKHRTLIERLYGKGIARYEVRRGIATPDGKPPVYAAVITIWIGSQEAFDAAAAQHSATIIADVPNFTDAMPLIQIDESV